MKQRPIAEVLDEARSDSEFLDWVRLFFRIPTEDALVAHFQFPLGQHSRIQHSSMRVDQVRRVRLLLGIEPTEQQRLEMKLRRKIARNGRR